MKVDRHSTRYFVFLPGELIDVTVKERGERVLAKLRGADGISAATRHSHALTFQMPESDIVEIELGTATTAEAHQLAKGPAQVILEIAGEGGQIYRQQISVEGEPGQWSYRLIPKAASASPAWYVCSRTPPCNRPPERTGPANVKCKVCGLGVIVKLP